MGLFITFEGGEGTGKTTQAAMLLARLRQEGHDALGLRERGGVVRASLVHYNDAADVDRLLGQLDETLSP